MIALQKCTSLLFENKVDVDLDNHHKDLERFSLYNYIRTLSPGFKSNHSYKPDFIYSLPPEYHSTQAQIEAQINKFNKSIVKNRLVKSKSLKNASTVSNILT